MVQGTTEIGSPVICHPGAEIISPLHVDDLRVLEFAASETIGIHRVVAIRNEALGLGYSFESIRSGKRVFVYDKDITLSPRGALIVMDGR